MISGIHQQDLLAGLLVVLLHGGNACVAELLINIGVDIVPTDRFYVAVGYNFRRAYELKAAGSSRFAGFTCGAGLNVKKFQLGLAYAKYHVSSPCFSVSLGYSIH